MSKFIFSRCTAWGIVLGLYLVLGTAFDTDWGKLCLATSFMPITQTCAVCKKKSEHGKVMSTNTMGSPDLDLRPPVMMRLTLPYNVEVCPHCGYCANDISEETSLTIKDVESEEYQSVINEVPTDSLAACFIRQAHGLEMTNQLESLPTVYLNAAWDCDDRRNQPGANRCREAALDAYDNLPEKKVEILLLRNNCQKVDMLRRCNRFEAAEKLALQTIDKYLKKCEPGSEKQTIRLVMEFQLRLIGKKDTQCHRINETTSR